MQFAAAKNAVNSVKFLTFQARLLDSKKRTALMLAAKNGCTECVQLLAPLESKLLSGDTSALELAAEGGHIDCVRVLLGYEPERARLAMFRARAKRFLEVANFVKEWISQAAAQVPEATVTAAAATEVSVSG